MLTLLTSHSGGDRVGIYFLEKGASQRPSKVIYDRAGSSIATATTADFNWKEIFDGAEWFHFTGITPALNDDVAAICLEACKAAKEAGVTVSCDLNYRNKLWSKEKAGQVMGELCKYVDVCIANEEDAADVFGIKAADTDVTKGEVNHEGYKDVAKRLQTDSDSPKLPSHCASPFLQMTINGPLCSMTETTIISARNNNAHR